MIRSKDVHRYALAALLGFVAINAVGGGVYGMRGADGMSTEWLQGTPFSDYFLPSLVLFVAIGGSFLLAGVAVFVRHRRARPAALCAGAVLLIWMAVQVSMIGYRSWMQPTMVGIALFVMILAIPLRPAPAAS